ncbi:MAG: flippase-like domain-containing protein [Candidatus Amulumruptor caecigallinarius]|nr:flippase-like domain-containing protein [Candidatus Amulumruptor caecigallinarius]MCM1397493.1 flippase-like domain-containing protein [Candidatus Amulumruptor caecigallinarius]MCM1454395.1 flippase-like domain-containing protein [bacterium]
MPDSKPTSAPTTAPANGHEPLGHEAEELADKLLRILFRYVLPTVISVALIVWLFHKVDIHKMMAIIRSGCDFKYIALMMVITTLSHMIRGVRWGIQLRAVGIPRMPVLAESVSIFGAYALNLVFPRLGEVWRCVYVAHRQDCSLMKVVGTDVGDRASDGLVVGLLAVLALIVAHPAIEKFLTHYAVGRYIHEYATDPWVWIITVAVIAILWTVVHFGKDDSSRLANVAKGLRNVWAGFKVLFTMNQMGLYILYTIGIWTCYYLETYVCFFAFPFTRELITQPGSCWGLVPGLVTFVFGSFSMAIPSNGGLGPWNLAVTFALSLYGISETQGAAFSMVMWSCQAAMLVALGLFSAAYIMVSRDRRRDHSEDSSGATASHISHTS